MQLFKEYPLSESVLKAIDELGFINPTPIQEKVIPAILDTGQDIIGLAQTGTGKTAGFGLPIIEQLDLGKSGVQALMLCPTRELCMQITNDLINYSKYVRGIKITAIYGGANIVPQIKQLKGGVNIVIGTPGRTLDLIKRRVLNINKIKWLVLDEADEMLNMGFKEDLDSILDGTPDEKQTLLFSATMPDGVRRIAENYMNNPLEISAGKKNIGAVNVEHQYYVIRASDRYKALKRLADINPNIYGIVFCRTRRETQEVADKLMQDGYNADSLHGDLSQAQRDHVMQRFRSRHLQLLVATDVAARGLDVQDLSHIINYNLPDDLEVYIHRSGRTGRAGKHGISITISHSREGRRIRELEQLVGKRFKYMKIPEGREICEKRLYNLIDKVETVKVDESKIELFLPVIYKKLEWLDREELIKHFVSVEFNRFLEYYKNAPDLNVIPEKGGDRKKRDGGKIRFTNFYINLGSKSGMKASNLIGLINEAMRRRDIEIGKIDIQRNFSFFEIDKDYDQKLLTAFEGAVFENTPVTIQISSPEKKGRTTEREFTKRNASSDYHRKNKKKKKNPGKNKGYHRSR